MDGRVTVSAVSEATGIGADRLCELARQGLVPFVLRGKQRRYLLSEAVAVIAALDLQRIDGILYRDTMRGRSVRRRRAERGGGRHTCSSCEIAQEAAQFPRSGRRAGIWTCRTCRRAQHAAEREELSVGYVKDQLAKKTGLKTKHLPSAMIEAHRAHLQVNRLIKSKRERDA